MTEGRASPPRTSSGRRRALAVAVGFLATGLLWGLAEVACARVNARRLLARGATERVPLDGATTLPRIDALARTAPTGALRMRVVKRNPSGVVFDVVYTIVPPGHRFTPCEAPEARKRDVVFLGCSYTFGDGVQDDETLPASVARVVSWARPSNLGYPGWGTHKVRALLDTDTLEKTVQERERPIAVYTFFDQHVRRALGSLRNYSASGPRYELRDGKLTVTGQFPEARGWLFPLLDRSEVLRFFELDVPLRVSDADLDLVAALVTTSRDAFVKKFPGGRFVCLFYPGSRYSAPLRPRIETAGVEVLDATALFDPSSPGLSIVGDGHPSPEAYSRVAAEVARFLER